MDPHVNLPLVASTLYCRPWHILPDAHQELGSLYRKYLKGDLDGREPRSRANHALPLPEARSEAKRVSSGIAWAFDDESGLAVVWLEGIICKRSPDMLSGPAVVDLAKFDLILKQLLTMPQITNIAIYLDTPGGCGIGLQESSALLEELGEGRTVIAYADFQCCSAGYWLAAACGEFYAAPSAFIGSIGTYIAALDSSRAFEMEGLELKLFRVGNLKALGAPGKQWSKEEEEFLQAEVEKHGGQFKSYIKSRRKGIEDASMQGQWFTAGDAPAGLVDGLFRDLEDLLAAMLEE